MDKLSEEELYEKQKEMPEETGKKKDKEKPETKKEFTTATKKSAFGKLKGIVKKKEEIKPVQLATLETEPLKILKFVLMTEKAVRMIELQNKLVFIVDRKSTSNEIKAATEAAFQTPVADVNTIIDQKGRKKAIIKFRQEGQAGEIAVRLGII